MHAIVSEGTSPITLDDVTYSINADRLQTKLMAPFQEERRKELLTHTNLMCLTYAKVHSTDHPPPVLPFATTQILLKPDWWTDERTVADIVKVIILNVKSEKGFVFLNLPRQQYRIELEVFVVSMQSHMRLPIHIFRNMPRC